MRVTGLLVLCVALPVISSAQDTKVRPFEVSIGVGADLTRFHGLSADAWFRSRNPDQGNKPKDEPSFGFSLVRSEYNSKRSPLTVNSFDATVLVGYWSNAHKDNLLGWHWLGGFGLTVWNYGVYEMRSGMYYDLHFKIGCGVDYYLGSVKNLGPKNVPLSVAIDLVRTIRPSLAQSGLPGFGAGNSILAGLRIWL